MVFVLRDFFLFRSLRDFRASLPSACSGLGKIYMISLTERMQVADSLGVVNGTQFATYTYTQTGARMQT